MNKREADDLIEMVTKTIDGLQLTAVDLVKIIEIFKVDRTVAMHMLRLVTPYVRCEPGCDTEFGGSCDCGFVKDFDSYIELLKGRLKTQKADQELVARVSEAIKKRGEGGIAGMSKEEK